MRERAVGVLRDNDRGRHTVPSSKLYPHQWAWDSAFAAIGWAHIDLERGCQELESILHGQWADGRIPHIQFSKTVESYFPGPESWGKEHSSTISNPPVWALAAEVLLQKGAEADRVRSWLPKIERSLTYLKDHRDPLGWNCIATCHPWENGQDNCPAWDRALEAVDPEEAPPFQRVDVKKVADPSQRPTDLQYKRYMALVHRFTQNGFQPANFVVYDPFFTTLTVLSEEAQKRMCDTLSHPSQAGQRAKALREGLRQHLWAPELGRYRYFDAIQNVPCHSFTLGSLSPVLLGDMPGRQQMLSTLDKEFSTPYGLPTVAPDSPDFDPVCYWRGPSWVNMNWLFCQALGAPLAAQTLDLMEQSGFWEYFHPHTGQGLGTDGFTWSAALALDLIDRYEKE